MHEYSIVQALLEQCEEHAKANDSTKITKVVTKIGKLSGVEPHLLETAFETFKERKGVCRDYAHMLITLARAAAIPARSRSTPWTPTRGMRMSRKTGWRLG